DIAEQLAKGLSDNVLLTDFTQRKILHLNAVIANNFTNHLLVIAQKICEQHGLPFSVLFPIIRQTTEQIQYINPSESQTGPAIRGDEATMAEHMRLLESNPQWQSIYKLLSQSIQSLP